MAEEMKVELNDAELGEVVGGKGKKHSNSSGWKKVSSRKCPACDDGANLYEKGDIKVCDKRGHYWKNKSVKEMCFENMYGTDPHLMK